MVLMQASQFPGSEVDNVLNFPVAAGVTFRKGRIVTKDGSGNLALPAANAVTNLLGVTMAAATAGVPAFGTRVPVTLADPDVRFIGHLWTAGGSAIMTPTRAHIGVSYGWITISNYDYVDVDDVANPALQVQNIIPELNAVVFKFIAAARQLI
jgi:hypothetical protein